MPCIEGEIPAGHDQYMCKTSDNGRRCAFGINIKHDRPDYAELLSEWIKQNEKSRKYLGVPPFTWTKNGEPFEPELT
jgi:hypothetical protein